jgi:UDP:flavonoid glycosyltransferase YjiC (YdhE family)
VPCDRAEGETLPAWVATLPDRPTVCATFGTVHNRVPEVFRAIIEGLRDEQVNLIATLPGPEQAVGSLERLGEENQPILAG